MRISNDSIKECLTKLMDEEAWSVDDVAALTGVSRPTLYRILDGRQTFVQRTIIRKLADGTSRTFKIDGDRVTFTKLNHETDAIPADLKELLDKYNKMTPAGKQQLLKIAGILCNGEVTESTTTN